MTKKYFCDFCGVHIQNNLLIRKRHNSGLSHQQKKKEYYNQFKTVAEILAEERQKNPCSRFLKGQCTFGAICRFSHYTRDEIFAMEAEGKFLFFF